MFKIKMFFPFNYEIASDSTPALNNSLSSSQAIFWRSNRIASSCENLPDFRNSNFPDPNVNLNNLSLLMLRSNSKSCNENANNLPEVNSLM